ncbi:MAG: hypothetical protein WBE76_24960 [Terracidiphilus sp.]
MASFPTFPSGRPPIIQPPSAEKITLQVKVDRKRCKTTDPEIEKRLKKLEKAGLTISIAQLVANANLHFAGYVKDDGEGEEAARMRQAWGELRHLNMRAVQEGHGKGQRKALLVDKSTNSRETARSSEVLAMGASLQVGIVIYKRRYSFWSSTPGLKTYDLSAKDSQGNELKVEARGRIDGTNRKKAVDQVHKKFKKADFSKAIGVILFPRTKAAPGKEDILVVDPDGDAEPSPSDAQYRNLLLHYVPIFTVQGASYAAFGRRLRAIASSSDRDFARYLSHGDAELSGLKRGRVGFDWKGTHYVGTYFEDTVWPEWLTGLPTPSEGGAFFWGLATEVLDRLQSGQVANLELPNEEAIVELRGHIFSIEMPDLSILAWGPSQSDLAAAGDREAIAAAREKPAARKPGSAKRLKRG